MRKGEGDQDHRGVDLASHSQIAKCQESHEREVLSHELSKVSEIIKVMHLKYPPTPKLACAD